MINHNILHKIIDKVAFIKWKTNLQKMNNIYQNVIPMSYNYLPYQIYYCTHCGKYECNEKKSLGYALKIYQMNYKYCYGCGKKKYLTCQFETQYKKN